jgi:hypothetical protein
MNNRIKALQLAQGLSGVFSVDSLLQGTEAFAAFLASADGTDEAKDAALGAAVLVAMRSADPGQTWASVVRDAVRVLGCLTAPASSAPPAPGASAGLRPEVP